MPPNKVRWTRPATLPEKSKKHVKYTKFPRRLAREAPVGVKSTDVFPQKNQKAYKPLAIARKKRYTSVRRLFMKKVFIVLTTVLAVLGMISCNTVKPAADTTPEPPPAEVVQEVFDYSQDTLILDGSAKSYTVKWGDTLSALAKQSWGKDRGYFFPIIVLASKDANITDPDIITPGTTLVIPDLDVNLANGGARGVVKDCLKVSSEFYSRKAATVNNPRLELDKTSRELAKLSDSL
jgi:hypothetical protein